MSENINVKKSTIYIVGIIVLVLIGGIFMLKGGESKDGGEIAAGVSDGEIQKVVLSQEGYNYRDTVAKSGKPIEISADSSVTGCLRSVAFNLGGKRYIKYLQNPQETLQLPALEKGTYNFACSMGMGYGKLIVE